MLVVMNPWHLTGNFCLFTPTSLCYTCWLVQHPGYLGCPWDLTTSLCRYMRHPGYLGWYLWAVGTQVLLLNPVTTVLFAVVVRQTGPSGFRIQSTLHFRTTVWKAELSPWRHQHQG